MTHNSAERFFAARDRIVQMGLAGCSPNGGAFQSSSDNEIVARFVLVQILDEILGPSAPNTPLEFAKAHLILNEIGDNQNASAFSQLFGLWRDESAAKLMLSGRAREAMLRQVKAHYWVQSLATTPNYGRPEERARPLKVNWKSIGLVVMLCFLAFVVGSGGGGILAILVAAGIAPGVEHNWPLFQKFQAGLETLGIWVVYRIGARLFRFRPPQGLMFYVVRLTWCFFAYVTVGSIVELAIGHPSFAAGLAGILLAIVVFFLPRPNASAR